MKYLITGSNGFIGTNLTNYLLSLGEEVLGLDYPEDLTKGLPPTTADILVHLAAETDVRKSIKNPSKTFIRNCKSTINCLEHARAFKFKKFIFISSCSAPQSLSPYSASKTACEAICNAYRSSYNMDISILRLSNVYGPHSIHKNSVISKFIKAYLDNKPVKIYGSGKQRRDFIHVLDVCRAIYYANKPLHIVAAGITYSIIDLCNILKISNVQYMKPIPGEVNIIEDTLINTDCISLQDGLADTLKWFKENYLVT